MKKSKIISRQAKVFCLLFVVVMLFSMMTVASAGSYATSGYFADGTFTPHDLKSTDSSIYFSNRSTEDLYVDIYGCNSSGGNARLCNVNGTNYVGAGETKYLANYIYENGYRYGKFFLYTGEYVQTSLYVIWQMDI